VSLTRILRCLQDGYVHVKLRQLPHNDVDRSDMVKVELTVVDTGKGISQDFIKVRFSSVGEVHKI